MGDAAANADAPSAADGGGAFTEEMIARLVDRFYTSAQTDEVLGPIFASRIEGHWDPHLERMRAFWSSVLRGTRRFHGDPMGKHVGLPGLSGPVFDRWLELFDDAADAVLPAHLARDVTTRARRMRVAIERTACPASAAHSLPPSHTDGPA